MSLKTKLILGVGLFAATGKTVTVAAPFTPGTLTLTVTWADGTPPFTYTVVEFG